MNTKFLRWNFNNFKILCALFVLDSTVSIDSDFADTAVTQNHNTDNTAHGAIVKSNMAEQIQYKFNISQFACVFS